MRSSKLELMRSSKLDKLHDDDKARAYAKPAKSGEEREHC